MVPGERRRQGRSDLMGSTPFSLPGGGGQAGRGVGFPAPCAISVKVTCRAGLGSEHCASTHRPAAVPGAEGQPSALLPAVTPHAPHPHSTLHTPHCNTPQAHTL